jgi:hypothetical protein
MGLEIRRDVPNPHGGGVHVKARGQGTGYYSRDPELHERQATALRMWREGYTPVEIAKHFAVSKRTAQKWIHDAIQRWGTAKEDADAWRDVLSARLLRLEKLTVEKIRDPGPAYGSSGRVVIDPDTGRPAPNEHIRSREKDRLAKIYQQLARLNGAERPVPSEVNLTVTTERDAQIARVAAALIAAGHGEDVARSLVESLTETARPAIPGIAEPPGGQDTPRTPPGATESTP